MIKLITSEKAVKLLEVNNTLTIEVDRHLDKKEIKKIVEDLFDVKINSINTLIRGNKKYAYVKLNPETLAIDVATKLGMI